MFFVVLMFHRNHFSICFVSDSEVVERLKIHSKYCILKHLLSRYQKAKKIKVVYEAGFCGFWLYRKLTKDGYSCIVTPPNLTPATTSKVKTDKRDAQKLALYLSARMLKSVKVPPKKVESDRRVIRCRAQIVKKQRRAKHQTQSTWY